MSTIEKQITINAPVDEVFNYLADLPRHSEWAAHRVQIQQTSEGPIGAGATFDSVNHMMGREFQDRITISEFAPNSKIAFDVIGKSGQFRHSLRFQEANGATRVTKSIEPVKVSPAFLSPLLRIIVAPRALGGDLKRIKANLES